MSSSGRSARRAAERASSLTAEDFTDDLDADQQAVMQQLGEDGAQHRRFVLSKSAKHRLDKFLQNRLKGLSRNQVQKLIGLGGVRVNDKPAKASLKLAEGDVVDVLVPARPADDLRPEPIPLDILHEEPGFIVINKQANLIVHPARSHLSGTLLNALAYHFQKQSESGESIETREGLSNLGRGEARPGVIHRLDKNTTGVIIVAKQDESHWLLAKQFEHRTNLKAYLALVHGCPEPPGGIIDEPLGNHPTIREAQAVRHDSTAKHALTVYRVRERYRGYSLVEVEIKTGRTHQIRVHMSFLGHPIVGDIMYGGEPITPAEIDTPPFPAGGRPLLTYARDKTEAQRMEAELAERDDVLLATPALHAAFLRMHHPQTGDPMTFTAPLHEPMLSLVRRLREHAETGEVVSEGVLIDLAQAAPMTSE